MSVLFLSLFYTILIMNGNTNIVENQQTTLLRDKTRSEKRIHEIDFVRGFCMLLVFMDHLFWNFRYFGYMWSFSSSPDVAAFFTRASENAGFYWGHPFRSLVRVAVLFTFLFVSGISTAFSKNNYKRAAQMLVFYFVIQIGTNLINPYWVETFGSNALINFNVIGVVALSVLAYSFFHEKSWRSLVIITFLLGIFYLMVLPFIHKDLSTNHSGAFNYINVWPLWQSNNTMNHEADYMPLFPYIITFFLGALFSRFAYTKRKSYFGKMKFWEKPICFIGRHSLIFYLAHQIIFVGLFALVGTLTGWGI